jgi:hypothetical protein
MNKYKHSSFLQGQSNICILYEKPCGLYYKSFTIIIYDHNDSGLYYKSFTIVIYGHNDSGLYYKAAIIAR